MKIRFGQIEVFPPNYFFDFMKWRKVTVGFSALLVILSLAVIFIKGLNYSIDFLGGVEVQIVNLKDNLTRDEISDLLHQNGIKKFELIESKPSLFQKNNSFLLRIPREKGLDQEKTSNLAVSISSLLMKTYGPDTIEITKSTSISGKIGKEEEIKGYLALALACLGILIYIAFRFDSRFAPGAVLCLVHNVIIALGFMTLFDKPFTTASIAAFLTIVGYSINDTVIVYDRIREMRSLHPHLNLIEVVNKSISQTMNRTVLTSVTTILALLVLSFLGGGSIEDFSITMLVGIVIGTYSSIYVAAPLTLMMDKYLLKLGFKAKRETVKTEKPDSDYAPPIYIRKKGS
jgi:preprotein translocase subunit SecF